MIALHATWGKIMIGDLPQWARIGIGALGTGLMLGALFGLLWQHMSQAYSNGPTDRSRPYRGPRKRHDGRARLLGRD